MCVGCFVQPCARCHAAWWAWRRCRSARAQRVRARSHPMPPVLLLPPPSPQAAAAHHAAGAQHRGGGAGCARHDHRGQAVRAWRVQLAGWRCGHGAAAVLLPLLLFTPAGRPCRCWLAGCCPAVFCASQPASPLCTHLCALPHTRRRYTHAGNRGVAFALFYSIMNVAALTQAGGAAGLHMRAVCPAVVQPLPWTDPNTAGCAMAGSVASLAAQRTEAVVLACNSCDTAPRCRRRSHVCPGCHHGCSAPGPASRL